MKIKIKTDGECVAFSPPIILLRPKKRVRAVHQGHGFIGCATHRKISRPVSIF
jgi:hypothetical protein